MFVEKARAKLNVERDYAKQDSTTMNPESQQPVRLKGGGALSLESQPVAAHNKDGTRATSPGGRDSKEVGVFTESKEVVSLPGSACTVC
jgi:hypothetical protein